MTLITRRRFIGVAGAAGVGSLVFGGTADAGGGGTGLSTVYIGSYSTWGEPPGRGLDVGLAGRDALTVTGTVSGVPDASFLAFSLNRRILYATNESAIGTVTAVDLDDPQRPVVLGSAPTRGGGPTHLSVHPSGRYLFTANYTDGTVVVHRLEPDGRIGPCTDLVQHTGTDRAPHAHQVLTDPSGRFMLAVDLGADSVFIYRLDLDTGKLALRHQLHLPVGAGPRHLTFHPHGRHAYILGELRPEITVATWDPAVGRLTPVQVVPTVFPESPTENFPSEIAVSRDARFVYAANRGDNTIAVLTIHDSGGRLSLTEATPTGGNWPRHFVLNPDQDRMYVANQRSNTITWLPRDPATGRLGAPSGSLPVNNVTIVTFA